MAGHVNMMDDVLISNMTPELLRSTLRVLVSQGPSSQKAFVKHVRNRLIEAPVPFPSPGNILTETGSLTEQSLKWLAWNRCLLSSKLASEALKGFTKFLVASKGETFAPPDERLWKHETSQSMQSLDGDIIQALQALKETFPIASATDEERLTLRTILEDLAMELGVLNLHRTFCPEGLKRPLLRRAELQLKDAMSILIPGLTVQMVEYRNGIIAEVPRLDIAPKTNHETVVIGVRTVPRLFNGLWQLSSAAWGSGTAEMQEAALVELTEAGLTATDMADHYGDAELVYNSFKNRLTIFSAAALFCATKWCVFGPINQPVTRHWVMMNVEARSKRVGGEIELLQFHWNDYSSKEYLEIIYELVQITEIRTDLVSMIGLCNFDSEHLAEVCEYMIARTGSVGVVSNQVQFSLIDSRPLRSMVQVCEKYNLKLMTYGSLCGGFLSLNWLGRPAPEIYSTTEALTPSQRKYYDMICTWRGWEKFQTLLGVLSLVANKHARPNRPVSITNVATRWVLQQPRVGVVVVGTRLGVSLHAADNLTVFRFRLDEADLSRIHDAALDEESVNRVFAALGDCGGEYRAPATN